MKKLVLGLGFAAMFSLAATVNVSAAGWDKHDGKHQENVHKERVVQRGREARFVERERFDRGRDRDFRRNDRFADRRYDARHYDARDYRRCR
jgi:hypothetical protein